MNIGTVILGLKKSILEKYHITIMIVCIKIGMTKNAYLNGITNQPFFLLQKRRHKAADIFLDG
jgi:hypothetical protein